MALVPVLLTGGGIRWREFTVKTSELRFLTKTEKVLMCARADKPGFAWQFPQGGIDNGETPLEAAYRELKEETGITSVGRSSLSLTNR